jgi:L-ascorbate metabolism protein UlaG (beta-lactamase superfamily)
MKLTKYTHACIVLEEQGEKLVIDPGGFTPEFGDV